MPSISHLLILLIGFFLIVCIAQSEDSVITVGPKGCDFYRIEAALDSAAPGDIIEVHSGEYYVNLNITTPLLTLQGKDTGEGKPVLRAGSSTADIENRGTGVTEMTVKTGGTAIAIREFGCKVDGFDITGVIRPIPYGSGEHNDLIGDAAIRVYSDGNTISNNNFYGNELTGIGLWNCSNNKIINNTIKDIPFGYAIELYNSNETTIDGNQILHNHWGIEMQRSDANIIENNEIRDSINDAVRAMKCNYSIISANIITGSGWESEYESNGKGISLLGSVNLINNNLIEQNRNDGIHIESIFWDDYTADNSYDNLIHKNRVRHNGKDGISLVRSWDNQLWDNNVTENHGNGIALTLSNNNTLEKSNISENLRGIFLYQSNYTKIANSTIADEVRAGIVLDQYCTGNIIHSNLVSNCTEGINISTGSSGNAIFANNLSMNPQPAWDYSGNSWDSNGRGNFYGQSDCSDRDGDGICDQPYLIAGGRSLDRFPLAKWNRIEG